MCVDWKEIRLQAHEYVPTYRALDVILWPCGIKETNYGGEKDNIPDDCNYDKQEMVDYLGPLKMLIW